VPLRAAWQVGRNRDKATRSGSGAGWRKEGPMARMLIISTHGSEDPTRAGIAFFLANMWALP